MEMSKENIFKIRYTSVLEQRKSKTKERTSKIREFIQKNKLITVTATIFTMCLSLNMILIYNFMKILENM